MAQDVAPIVAWRIDMNHRINLNVDETRSPEHSVCLSSDEQVDSRCSERTPGRLPAANPRQATAGHRGTLPSQLHGWRLRLQAGPSRSFPLRHAVARAHLLERGGREPDQKKLSAGRLLWRLPAAPLHSVGYVRQ